jgi:hypothetical protein
MWGQVKDELSVSRGSFKTELVYGEVAVIHCVDA